MDLKCFQRASGPKSELVRVVGVSQEADSVRRGHSTKDPAVLKTLRDSEFLRRSVFTTPPILTTL